MTSYSNRLWARISANCLSWLLRLLSTLSSLSSVILVTAKMTFEGSSGIYKISKLDWPSGRVSGWHFGPDPTRQGPELGAKSAKYRKFSGFWLLHYLFALPFDREPWRGTWRSFGRELWRETWRGTWRGTWRPFGRGPWRGNMKAVW